MNTDRSDILGTLHCRACGDVAARPGDPKVYRDLDGELCRACYMEIMHGDVSHAIRSVQRSNRTRARLSRKR